MGYAVENIDRIAQQHVQIASGERINLHAGHGVAMFAHSDGVSAIANHGKVTIQSQNDDTQAGSAKHMQLTAAGRKRTGAVSDEVVFVTSGGAYPKLRGGDIELGCPRNFAVKSAGHLCGGATSMKADMSDFGQASLDRVPKLIRASDGDAAPGFDGRIQTASSALSNLTTDSAGELPAVDTDEFERLAVQFLKKNI